VTKAVVETPRRQATPVKQVVRVTSATAAQPLKAAARAMAAQPLKAAARAMAAVRARVKRDARVKAAVLLKAAARARVKAAVLLKAAAQARVKAAVQVLARVVARRAKGVAPAPRRAEALADERTAPRSRASPHESVVLSVNTLAPCSTRSSSSRSPRGSSER